MRTHKLFLAMGLSIALSACETMKHHEDLHGPKSSLSEYGAQGVTDDGSCKATICNEDNILNAYARRAGLQIDPTSKRFTINATDWRDIVRAGFNAIDEQCENYMEAMFWADREMRTARDDINLLGSTTGTLMGVFGGPATAIATTAAVFGLATQSLTNESKGLFFDIEPSGVRRIVSRNQTAYRQAVETRINSGDVYNSRPAAVAAIQGYLTLCLPSHIATQINEAVDSSKFEIADTGSKTPVPEVKLTPPAQEPKKQNSGDEDGKTEDVSGKTVQPATKESVGSTNCQGNDCDFKHIQQTLCITNPSGVLDGQTKKAIDFFRTTDVLGNIENTGELTNREKSFLLEKKGCFGFNNAYERFLFSQDVNLNAKTDLKSLSMELKSHGVSDAPSAPQTFNDLRSAIKQFEISQNPPLPPTGVLTPDLHRQLSK
jgi:hypothetical protein